MPPLRLVEEMRIGSTTDPKLIFYGIRTVDVDRDGNVYVIDDQGAQIRVFDASGKPLRTIGRRGQGPGEFQTFIQLGIKGDTVWVLDGLCRGNLSLFSRSGALLSTRELRGLRFSVQIPTMVGVVKPLGMRADGQFVGDEGQCFAGGAADTTINYRSTDTVPVPRVLFGTRASAPNRVVVLDTLGWHSYPPPERLTRDSVMIEGRFKLIPRPLADSPLGLPMMDGHIAIERRTPQTAAQSSIRITRTRLAGDTVYSRVFRYTPVRYNEAVLNSIAQESAKSPSGMTGYTLFATGERMVPRGYASPTAAAALVRARMKYPLFQTPIANQPVVGADDGIWLRREDDGGTNFHWLLLDAQGRPRGRVDVPRAVRIAWSSGNTVWAIVPDSDDVPWLVRYRIATG